LRISYRYGGVKKVTEHIVDAENETYYDKFAKTTSDQVIVNKVQDTRLDVVLKDLETRISGDSSVPSQVGNSGKFLSTNGSTLEWRVIDALPSQTNNADKVLSTNGSSAYWAVPLKLTSTIYPAVSDNKLGSYGVSSEAARADHKHPLPVYFIESYMTAIGGETEITLTEEQYPSNNRPTGFHLYRNGLLLSPTTDYTFDSVNKRITFSKACAAKENIIIVLGYLLGDSNISVGGNSINISDVLNAILDTEVVPLMDGEAAIGTSEKVAREDHKHPSDTSKANINSPLFTGTPRILINPTVNTNDNSIATTKFVNDQINTKLLNIIPAQSESTAGKVLASDGSRVFWKTDQDSQELPQIEYADIGKFLIANTEGLPEWVELSQEIPDSTESEIGSVLTLDSNKNPVWSVVPNEIPEINDDTSNKILSNNGANLTWVNNEHIILSNLNPRMNSNRAYPGVLNEAARIDHEHEHDNTKADIDSPIFTGDPQSPTPLTSNNSTSIATTAFVNNLVSREISRVETANNNYILQNSSTLFTLQNINEKLQDLGNLDSNIDNLTIDFSLGNHALVMLNNDISFSFTINSIANSNFRKVSLTLYNANQYMIEWPENVHWDGIYAPMIETVMTTIEFITFNNGGDWYGKVWGNFN
jgi:hypothetical protein